MSNFFTWEFGAPPPSIQEHSIAKLNVLRSYLCAYFDRLCINSPRDEFKLDLIDGFSGGGIFTDHNGVEVLGSPLVMLEEARAAEIRLNRNRTKNIHFDIKYYFVDKKEQHTAYLKSIIKKRGFNIKDENIVVLNYPFDKVADRIIKEVQKHQPRAGRAIFLLDQTGYSQVGLKLVANIFANLPTAEVILTFAADIMANFLDNNPRFIKTASRLDFTPEQIEHLLSLKVEDEVEQRARVQRVLLDNIYGITRAEFYTPFFIRPRHSRRALWFLHLSGHPTARNVMINIHWEHSNTFEHYGRGDFNMLGWDPLKELPLFDFGKDDEKKMHDQLLESMPNKLYALVSEQPVTVDAIHHEFANQTAARYSDIDKIIVRLVEEGDFVILDPDGKVRTRSVSTLKRTDLIALSPQPLIPSISRLNY